MQFVPRIHRPHVRGLSSRATHWLIALAALVVILAALGFWLSRESTLQDAARWAVAHSNGAITIDDPHGSLLSRATASRIVWRTPTRVVTFDRVLLRWNPLWLLAGVVAVDNASADRMVVALQPSANNNPLTPPSSLQPRMRVRVAHAHVGELDIARNGSTTAFRDVGFTAGAGWRDWYFKLTPAQTPWGLLTADLTVGEKAPFNVDGTLGFTRKSPQPVDLAIKVHGPLERLGLDATLTARASKLTATATATPYAPLPFTAVDMQLVSFDPQDFVAGAPSAKLQGRLHAAPAGNDVVRGDVRIDNPVAGTLDQHKLPLAGISANITGKPDLLQFADLVVDLGAAGKLTGDASLQGTQVSVNLAGKDVNGHGVYSWIKPDHLGAKLAVNGDLKGQDVNVSFNRKGYDVSVTGHMAPDAIVIKSARAHIRGGTLQASGRLGLGPDHAYALDAKLDGFDLVRLGLTQPPFMAKPAVLSGTISAAGAVAPRFDVRADVKLAHSTIAGLPATANFHWRSVGTKDVRVAVKGNARLGDTTLAVDGHAVDPQHLESLDARLDLAGPSMGQLFDALDVPLPPTAAYRLSGRLQYGDNVWTLRDFKGKVGNSDLEGTYVVDRRGDRPSIKANLLSTRLDIADLQGFLGKKPGAAAAPPGKVLPESHYSFDKLRASDVDVTFTGQRFVNPRLPLTDMQTHLVLKRGLMTLNPLRFGAAGGKLDGFVIVDARQPVIEAKSDLRGTGLNLNKLLPSVKSMVDSTGKVDARVQLDGHGNSFAALLGSSNGSIAAVMEGGSVSDVVLRLANLDLANTLVAMAKGNQAVPIRCLVADFRAEKGTLVPEPLLLDTEHTLVKGEGSVDLADETLALRLVATPKDGSVFALRGPIDVQGPFAKPNVKPELGQAIARVGAAVALGALAGPAAILPFLEPGTPARVDCHSYAEKARSFITQP